jgi:putative tryptophan/tyrosine transport system substrate-binding protein
MKRSLMLLLIVVVSAAGGIISEAQQGRIYRIGVLPSPGKAEERLDIKGLRAGLAEAGYVESKNLQLNIPNVETYDDLRSIAKGYVEKKVDIIVTNGGTATGIAREATKEIPIIFIWGLSDPVEAGFVKSLAHPGANITGLTSEGAAEIYGKRLELFKEVVPSLRRVTLLYNARGENPGHARSLTVVREVAPKLGLKLNEKPAKSVGDVDEMVRVVSKKNSDGIFTICSGLFVEAYKKIVTLAIRKQLPFWGCSEESVEQGALLSYRPDRFRSGYRGAWYVEKILKGAKPAELPVEQPTKFEFIVNLKTAKQIGLTIPPNVLARADKVIR